MTALRVSGWRNSRRSLRRRLSTALTALCLCTAYGAANAMEILSEGGPGHALNTAGGNDFFVNGVGELVFLINGDIDQTYAELTGMDSFTISFNWNLPQSIPSHLRLGLRFDNLPPNTGPNAPVASNIQCGLGSTCPTSLVSSEGGGNADTFVTKWFDLGAVSGDPQAAVLKNHSLEIDYAWPGIVPEDVIYLSVALGLGDLQGELTSPVSAVPIPAAAWLFGSAVFALIGWGRVRRKVV